MSMLTKKAISRRTILRGAGAALALPLLDSMVPAFTPIARTAARVTPRLGFVYMPNGVIINQWTPAAEGRAYDFTPILKPLEPFRDRLTVLTGLTQNRGGQTSKSGAVHGRCATRYLTGTIPRPFGQEGTDFRAEISLDQAIAKELSKETQLSSLELAMESGDVGAGTCDGGFSCTYAHTISWRGPTTPLSMEYNPRAVFERMFGDAGSTDTKARLSRMKEDRSLLDSVTEDLATLQRTLGPSDVAKVSEYLEAIREVERRIQKAEEQSGRELPRVGEPAGVPAAFEAHAQLMFDLQVLAYQSDLTRVITFMTGREFSSRTYPEIGAPGAHHPLSHEHSGESQAQLLRINTHHAAQFAYYLKRLKETPDGDGSLLDHIILYFGCGMSTGDHSPDNLPLVLAGGGGGQIKGGQHLKYPGDTPLANLHLTVLDMLGLHRDSVHDSIGELREIRA